ncbi:hypothetical protein SAMN04487851_11011 [Prevotella sp. tc2-28]|uniref:type IX secretion system anionic LPS delivery protein PorZ n=1 Tax=Prevotella sp. tc2-28 TaxID=1761888 RepID=UPI00089BC7A3|nr:hypothetical protein [Prevotella sp. tc2-28]SEA64164.1 hypothetical protein SAMN04487851_11011 [Prevotella sp. tc2-28]
MKKLIVALLLCIIQHTLCIAQIGTWRNYLAYDDIQQIQAAGNYLFVRASNALYQYNKQDQSIVTYDKTNGLNDTDITQIRWCQQAKRLIIVYQNSNIDLIDTEGNVTNISALYNKIMTGDKTVSSIRIDGVYAYLICGFGIVKMNVQRAEIADIYTPTQPNYPQILPDEDNSDYDKYIDLVKTLKPGGPKYNSMGTLKFINNRLYTCNGDLNGTPASLQRLENDKWTVFGDESIKNTTGVEYLGLVCIEEDPTDKEHIFAGGRNGLYEFKNGKFLKFYNHKNSPIESVFSTIDPEYEFVTGLLFDPQGNLLVMNSESHTHCILKLKNNGEWLSFNHPELLKYNGIGLPNLSQLMYDHQGLIWFVNNNWTLPALYCYQSENDAIKAYENLVNQDGTTINAQDGVRCVAEDAEHNIWVGSSGGPFMLERKEINNNGGVFTQVKVPRNDGTDYADYLLAGIDIMCLAIDGGNRKWFGTNGNGVYLISSDNMKEIHHFTSENSKLLSNVVKSIAINPTTGEVFFGTDNGLCSYFSDATKPNTEMTKDNVWAYPNPVEPSYTGPITVTGLSFDADVKILSSNGVVINEGRSNGGTFVWDGCDKKGRRVNSGVYMVVTATNNGEKGTVCKIAVIR